MTVKNKSGMSSRMSILKKPVELETLANAYALKEVLGEGGAGRVYGGTDADGHPVAVKVLTVQGRDKRKRFVNESNFLRRNPHPNLVPVLDDGVANAEGVKGPFYVMPRYKGSLRGRIGSLPPADAMALFSGILDGVEAAHLLGVVHRDIKPENILLSEKGAAAVGDFGIASFTDDHLVTLIETAPTSRLANFQYAAPEQRVPGRRVGVGADIYALGLILNELFTGTVPHGTGYKTIGAVSADHGYLDPIVAQMIAQSPEGRHPSIQAVKQDIQKYHAEAVSLQKLNELSRTVVPEGDITEPLALRPPTIIGAEWDRGQLIMTLDQPVSPGWVNALHNIGNYTSLMGHPPQSVSFHGAIAKMSVSEGAAQQAIDYFKQWLQTATRTYRDQLEASLRQQERNRLEALKREREAEEARLRVNRSLRF